MTAPSLTLPPLVYGAWRLQEDPEGSTPARILAKVDSCLENGIDMFDHADIYGHYTCEELFGRAMAERPSLRQQIRLVSKCGIKLQDANRPGHGVKHYDTDAAHIIASAEASLRQLRCEHLDLLLLHRPDPLLDADAVCNAFDALRNAGKVLHFGVSNFTPAQFDLLQSRLPFPLVTNQVELSILHLDPITDGTLDHCQRQRVQPMAWSPLGGGRIFKDPSERLQQLRAALSRIGEELGKPHIDQVALAFLLHLPARVSVVIGTNSVSRIRSAAGAKDMQLTRQQWFDLYTAGLGHAVA